MSSSKFPSSEATKQVLPISNDSRKIKKPPRPPRIKYEVEPRIINVKTPTDFTYIVQLLTGDPKRPPPVYPCNCDHDVNPQPPDDRPQGILSPTPTSLPLIVSPNDFTLSPSPPPPLLPPSFDQDFNIDDLLEELAVEPPTLSSPPVITISPSPSPPRSPFSVPQPIFRVPPSPIDMLNTEIPPNFNTPLAPLLFPPYHFPPYHHNSN